MVNYRVEELHGLLAESAQRVCPGRVGEAAGIGIRVRQKQSKSLSAAGLLDPDGNKIELWGAAERAQ